MAFSEYRTALKSCSADLGLQVVLWLDLWMDRVILPKGGSDILLLHTPLLAKRRLTHAYSCLLLRHMRHPACLRPSNHYVFKVVCPRFLSYSEPLRHMFESAATPFRFLPALTVTVFVESVSASGALKRSSSSDSSTRPYCFTIFRAMPSPLQ